MEPAESDAMAADQRPGGFARIRMRKGSYLKALATGLSRDLSVDYAGGTRCGRHPRSRPDGHSEHRPTARTAPSPR
ncbi:hypothetical protein ACFYO2_13545 [Streptomyces sp. NPDC006602]|uniref:hypothetical protein n=1 Tax=Streptomyces sp. NPDC006602 TaxID=3364751 RepID=UPI00368A23F2